MIKYSHGMKIITMARPKKNMIKLTDDEVKYLKAFLKRKDTNQLLSARCRILLNLDEDHLPALTYDQCMSACNVSRATIARTVKLFASGGIDTALEINRNINSDNARRKVDGRTEAKIIEIACGPVPEGHSRWTIQRSLKKQTSTSPQQLLVPPKQSRCRIRSLHGRYP